MNRDYFWLTKEQFARLEPLLPSDTRGKPRVDDRRVISGIVHVLKSGGRWVDAPDVYGPRKMGCQGCVGRHFPCSGVGRRPTGTGPDRLLGRQGSSLRIGR